MAPTGSRIAFRSLTIAAVLLVPGVLLCWSGFSAADPDDWPGPWSPPLDLREPGEHTWISPPFEWDRRRGEASLELHAGFEWRAVPMDVDCAMRVSIRERSRGVPRDSTLGTADLRWGRGYLGTIDVTGGFEVRVVVERTSPELGIGFLRVYGTYEQDTHDMDFVRVGAQRIGVGFVGVAVLLALVGGRALAQGPA